MTSANGSQASLQHSAMGMSVMGTLSMRETWGHVFSSSVPRSAAGGVRAAPSAGCRASATASTCADSRATVRAAMAMHDPNAKGDLARVVQHKATIVRDSSQVRVNKKMRGSGSLLPNAHREERVLETARARFCASQTAAATLRPQYIQNATILRENHRTASGISKQKSRCALASTRNRLTESTKSR